MQEVQRGKRQAISRTQDQNKRPNFKIFVSDTTSVQVTAETED